jgi:hypothetical protein
MKLKIDNYSNFLVFNQKEVLEFQSILTDLLESEIMVENIERINKKNSVFGIKSSSIKEIVDLILTNCISHYDNPNITITTSNINKIYIINYKDMKFCLKFQTANWAVLYKDFFQFTNDKTYQDFNSIFYLVPDKQLCNYLSSGTVNYENTLRFIKKYSGAFNYNFSIFGLNIVNE